MKRKREENYEDDYKYREIQVDDLFWDNYTTTIEEDAEYEEQRRYNRERFLQLTLEAIETLPEKKKQILKGYYFSDLNQTELAQKVGLSQTAISLSLHSGYRSIENGKTYTAPSITKLLQYKLAENQEAQELHKQLTGQPIERKPPKQYIHSAGWISKKKQSSMEHSTPIQREVAVAMNAVSIFQSVIENIEKRKRKPRHGTINMYANQKCRCEKCRKASARYSRRIYRSKK